MSFIRQSVPERVYRVIALCLQFLLGTAEGFLALIHVIMRDSSADVHLPGTGRLTALISLVPFPPFRNDHTVVARLAAAAFFFHRERIVSVALILFAADAAHFLFFFLFHHFKSF
jgi:hypothetical protein